MEEEEGQEQGTRLVVTVPDGVEAGQALLVEAPGGRELSVEVPEGLGPGDQLEVWVSDEEGEDGMAELEESASASEAPEPQAQGPEELAAAQAQLNTSLGDLEQARADVSGAVEKAREQERLRTASEAEAARYGAQRAQRVQLNCVQ
jgi:hypothetical protein